VNDLSRWVGADEHSGVPSQRPADTHPPAGRRLDAIAAAERVRSLAILPDGASLAFVHDRDGSDVWVVELGPVAPSCTAFWQRVERFLDWHLMSRLPCNPCR